MGKKTTLSFKSTTVDWGVLVKKIEHGVVVMDQGSAGQGKFISRFELP